MLTAFALAGVGIGFGVAGHRKVRSHGKLLCESLETEDGQIVPLVGVRTDYDGDWWEQRGRRLYWKARRQGAQTAAQIAQGIVAADVGSDSICMAQFPPHAGTHERNQGFWNSLVEHVQREMGTES